GPAKGGEPPLASSLFPDEILDLLSALVDKSLVVYEEGGESGGRYRMLETVRQYAIEKLRDSGQEADVRARHRDYFAAFAELAEPELMRSDQSGWIDRLELEHDNLRGA